MRFRNLMRKCGILRDLLPLHNIKTSLARTQPYTVSACTDIYHSLHFRKQIKNAFTLTNSGGVLPLPMQSQAHQRLISPYSTEADSFHSHNFYYIDDINQEAESTLIIRAYPEKHKVPWGLVLVRSTYTSPSKWDLFLKTTKDRTRRYLEKYNALDLWDSLSWTILEEKEGADIFDCSERFRSWVETEGVKELSHLIPVPSLGHVTTTGGCLTQWCGPRYEYFIHVDEAVVEGVFSDRSNSIDSDSEQFWFGKGENHFMVVSCFNILRKKKDWKEILDDLDEAQWYCKRAHGANMYTIFLCLTSPEGFEHRFGHHEREGFYWLTHC